METTAHGSCFTYGLQACSLVKLDHAGTHGTTSTQSPVWLGMQTHRCTSMLETHVGTCWAETPLQRCDILDISCGDPPQGASRGLVYRGAKLGPTVEKPYFSKHGYSSQESSNPISPCLRQPTPANTDFLSSYALELRGWQGGFRGFKRSKGPGFMRVSCVILHLRIWHLTTGLA